MFGYAYGRREGPNDDYTTRGRRDWDNSSWLKGGTVKSACDILLFLGVAVDSLSFILELRAELRHASTAETTAQKRRRKRREKSHYFLHLSASGLNDNA